MTLHELSQLYFLDREIELDRERLAQLQPGQPADRPEGLSPRGVHTKQIRLYVL